ncbi:MAG: biotin--[acetyl-CoA-carboxylase] ligase [Flavobacteriales bacterium]|jgi:BirA family biotin operon repressor/biotin-[acetyl-CoA-carboxylase] ligase|nr:biotin--[acetyl-CoA-carboxylase] ligase [Flavobacteriales bacterium]
MKIQELKEVVSTNDYIKTHKTQFQSGDCVYAIKQTGGKGQRGNTWQSDGGKNITASIYLSWKSQRVKNPFSVSQLVSIALMSACKRFMPQSHLTIKWPNDLYVDDKKIGGILIENSNFGEELSDSIIGFGININQTNFEFLDREVTSFKLETGKEYTILNVLTECVTNINEAVQMGMVHHHQNLNNIYHRHLYLKDIPATFEDKRGTFFGKIKGVNSWGQLVIKSKNGLERIYNLKEVKLLPEYEES